MIGLIVARSKNNVIGKNGNIPWKIKGEQKQFRELTTGNVVIMGRKSYEEIGHPLPNRMNIVVSTTTEYQGDNLVSVNYHIGVGQIFRSGPGGTITASTTATYTVGVTSNVSASITTGQIVKASISAGFSNSTSSSRSTSYKYSRSISPGRYGNMQYGNYGAQVNVKKPPLSLHAMSKCSLLEAQSCPVRTYGVTDIGKARPL